MTSSGYLFFHGFDFGLQRYSLLLVGGHLLGVVCQLSLLLLQCLMSPPLLLFTCSEWHFCSCPSAMMGMVST